MSYPDIAFEGFINNKIKTGSKDGECIGYPVISYSKYLKEYAEDTVVVIASRLYHDKIYNQLKNSGITDNLIINARKMTDDMSTRQYFDLPEINERRCKRESFIDAGSSDGKTSVLFTEWCRKDTDNEKISICAFDLDKKNVSKCKEMLRSFNKSCSSGGGCHVINKGLWDEEKVFCFQSEANGTSKISEDGGTNIYVDRLDHIIPGDEEVTFIKMDIEGSEYKGLLGAKNKIGKCKPKLAIGVYHRPEDIWELPDLILRLNGDYQFYFGHYSVAAAETVLYALCRGFVIYGIRRW